MASTAAPSSTIRALQTELGDLTRHPVEGFDVKVANEDNLFEWDVAIYGPPDTIYQGGLFKARIKFPTDYPFSPPKVMFVTEMWHPNIFYPHGELCISILHPPVNDPTSGERPEERWNPTQNVRTILISVISMLSEPNISSPANVDASVMYRTRRNDYNERVRQLVLKSKADAEKEGIFVPSTVEEYTMRTQLRKPEPELDAFDMLHDSDDHYDDDMDDSYEEDDEDDDEEAQVRVP